MRLKRCQQKCSPEENCGRKWSWFWNLPLASLHQDRWETTATKKEFFETSSYLAGTSRCGGSLVNEWYVVTAGHCVARSVNRPGQVRITLGEYVLKSSDEPLPGRTYGASAIKVHPYFKFTPQADRYDVAVIRLNRRVDMAPHISPLCLPPKGMDMTGINGWASGWGALQPGSRLRPKTLQVRLASQLESPFWLMEQSYTYLLKNVGKAAPEMCLVTDEAAYKSFRHCRLWTFQWLKIANASVGIAIRVLTWSSTTRWSAPATTGAAKTPVRATRVGPWWRKSRAVGPSSALFRPDTHVQNEASRAFTTGWPKPPIGSPTQSTLKSWITKCLSCDNQSHTYIFKTI